MRRCAGAPISGWNWSSSADILPGRPSPTNGSSAIAPAKSCCQLKSPYKDGTSHIVMEPLEFMERLAALVPRPRLHLIRFHGVLAPNAKLRSQIVPAPAERATESPTDHAQGQGETPRMSWARLLKRVFDIDVEHYPNCGGALKIIAAIEDPPVVIKILSHLGLPTRAPPRSPARRVDLFQTIWEPKIACPRKPTHHAL